MAILEYIEAQKKDKESSKEREIEIKELIFQLEVGKGAVVQIDCPIESYRTSFRHYLQQYNNANLDEARKFSICKTDKKNIWEIIRLK